MIAHHPHNPRAVTYGALIAWAHRPPETVLPGGFALIAEILLGDTVFGFLAASHADPSEAVLVLAGAGNSLVWYDGLHVAFVPFPGHAAAGNVGQGYLTAYDNLKITGTAGAGFASDLGEVLGKEHRSLVVAAHGFGAALATIYVMDSAKRGGLGPTEVYTFGSPRVGDAEFVAAYNALRVPTLRVANYRDLAQRIPAADYNYAHVGSPLIVDSLGVAQLDHECTHGMETYLHLLDPSHPLGAGCRPTGVDEHMAAYIKRLA